MTVTVLWNVVIDCLVELCDEASQKALWLYGKDEISSFTEAICGLFDDSGLMRALDRDEICEPLKGMFLRLDRLIDQVPENENPKIIISHPAMQDVRLAAKNLLDHLQSK